MLKTGFPKKPEKEKKQIAIYSSAPKMLVWELLRKWTEEQKGTGELEGFGLKTNDHSKTAWLSCHRVLETASYFSWSWCNREIPGGWESWACEVSHVLLPFKENSRPKKQKGQTKACISLFHLPFSAPPLPLTLFIKQKAH